MIDGILQAGRLALPDREDDERNFWFGCVGIRNDGVVVSSRNGSVQQLFSKSLNPDEMQKISDYHAEGRVLKKMTRGGTLYVARVSRQTRQLQLARPCGRCRARIRSYRIDKVYYSISNDEYGLWLPMEAEDDKIF